MMKEKIYTCKLNSSPVSRSNINNLEDRMQDDFADLRGTRTDQQDVI